MAKTIRAALNGCNYAIDLCGIEIYHVFEPMGQLSMEDMGAELDKDAFILSRVSDEKNIQLVKDMLVDWRLYKRGWLVSGDDSGRYRNKELLYYKQQLGDYGLEENTPKALYLLEPHLLGK